MVSVTVRGRIPGREGTGDVRLEVAPSLTARELIGAVVAGQLAEQGPAVWAECSRLYSTDEEIAAMAARGVVRSGAPEPEPGARAIARPKAQPSVPEATARAVQAFERGVFVMFAGANRIGGPDEIVSLRDGDRVVFLRLTALVGG